MKSTPRIGFISKTGELAAGTGRVRKTGKIGPATARIPELRNSRRLSCEAFGSVAPEILTQILPVRTFVLSFINKITHPWALNLFPLVGRSLAEEA
jgi:hypothetical protein